MNRQTVVAVLGKGGTGKTVVSALIARSLLDLGIHPLLLVDADPAGGLVHALAEDVSGHTMGEVRERLIREAAEPGTDRDTVAERIDWMALEVLREHERYALLSMGRTESQGCFCPVNSLLRDSIEKLASGFRFVILDAEAGIEQVNRQVVREIDVAVLLTDGSQRGLVTVQLLERLVRTSCRHVTQVGVILNRAETLAGELPVAVSFWGRIPPDGEVERFDREGRSLLALPPESVALRAVRGMVEERLIHV